LLYGVHVALEPALESVITAQEGLPATGQATYGDDRCDRVVAAVVEVVVEQIKVPAWEGDRADMFDVLFHGLLSEFVCKEDAEDERAEREAGKVEVAAVNLGQAES
jgi:hypothetical protein